jgi:hypothetical protein
MNVQNNTHNLPRNPINPVLLATVRARLKNVARSAPTSEPIELRWTEPTPPDDTHPDDWIDHLPIRPGRLPSRYKLFRMSKGRRAAVLIMQIVSADLEIEGAWFGRFAMPCDPEEREWIARNARRRKTLAIKRALEFGLWKNGRWQIGNLWQLVDTLEKGHVNDGC